MVVVNIKHNERMKLGLSTMKMTRKRSYLWHWEGIFEQFEIKKTALLE